MIRAAAASPTHSLFHGCSGFFAIAAIPGQIRCDVFAREWVAAQPGQPVESSPAGGRAALSPDDRRQQHAILERRDGRTAA